MAQEKITALSWINLLKLIMLDFDENSLVDKWLKIIIKDIPIDAMARIEKILFSASVAISFMVNEWYHMMHGQFRNKYVNY